MRFFRTSLRVGGTPILINIQHIENVYDSAGQATFAMLPAGQERQRVFETSCPFDEAVSRLLGDDDKEDQANG